MAEAVLLFVNHGADVTALDITHLTPLHLASLRGVPEAIRILIEHGADVNAQNETNLTPLHMASLVGNTEGVQLLIKHGADVTSKDWNLKTPLHFASSWVSSDTASFIFQLKAEVNEQEVEIQGHMANPATTPNAKANIVRLLIKHGADVTAQDKTLWTALHMASSLGLIESVRTLIGHGADVNAQNETDLTPLHQVASPVRNTIASFLNHRRTVHVDRTICISGQ